MSGQWDRSFTVPAGEYYFEYTAQSTGTYAGVLFEVPAPQVFEYTLGTPIQNGSVGSGSGNLETIASVDRYHFVLTAPKTLQYDEWNSGKWNRLVNAAGQVVGASGQWDRQFTVPAGEYYFEYTEHGAGTYAGVLSTL